MLLISTIISEVLNIISIVLNRELFFLERFPYSSEGRSNLVLCENYLELYNIIKNFSYDFFEAQKTYNNRFRGKKKVREDKL